MVTIVIGKNRNIDYKNLDTDIIKLEIEVSNGVLDKRINVKKLFTEIEILVNNGYKNIFIPNIEMLFPLGSSANYYEQLGRLKNINFYISTEVPFFCWDADDIIYKGDKTFTKSDKDKILWGNVLEVIESGFVYEPLI